MVADHGFSRKQVLELLGWDERRRPSHTFIWRTEGACEAEAKLD